MIITRIRFDAIAPTHVEESGTFHVSKRRPLGIVLLIMSWTDPFISLAAKLAPALACGNTVVVKPSELSPLSATALAEIAQEAGLPAGAMNVLHGYGTEICARLCANRLVSLVSFTGKPETARQVAAAASATLKTCHLK